LARHKPLKEGAVLLAIIPKGILLVSYFCLLPLGLVTLMNQFNKASDRILLLYLFAMIFLMLLLFAIITVAVVFKPTFPI
jgi:hypothetical protein